MKTNIPYIEDDLRIHNMFMQIKKYKRMMKNRHRIMRKEYNKAKLYIQEARG